MSRQLQFLGVTVAQRRAGFAVESVGGTVIDDGLNGKLEIMEIRDESVDRHQVKRDANGQNQIENGRFHVEGLEKRGWKIG